jgi:hypothetical protein
MEVDFGGLRLLRRGDARVEAPRALRQGLDRGYRRGRDRQQRDVTGPDSLFFLVLTAVFFYFMVIRKPRLPLPEPGAGTT